MRHEAGHQDKIERSVADHLIGDADPADPCVSRFRPHDSHCRRSASREAQLGTVGRSANGLASRHMRRFTGNPVCGTKSHLRRQFVLKSSRVWLDGRARAPVCVGIDRAGGSQMRDEGYKMWGRVSRRYLDVVVVSSDPIPWSHHPIAHLVRTSWSRRSCFHRNPASCTSLVRQRPARTPARCIVSLLPSAAEIVCALDLADRLMAVIHECDQPADELKDASPITSNLLPPERTPSTSKRRMRHMRQDP
jgi:hypothetical protein